MYITRMSRCTHVYPCAIVCYAALHLMCVLPLACTYMRAALYANVIRSVCVCCSKSRAVELRLRSASSVYKPVGIN